MLPDAGFQRLHSTNKDADNGTNSDESARETKKCEYNRKITQLV